jgi:hypothetical protein
MHHLCLIRIWRSRWISFKLCITYVNVSYTIVWLIESFSVYSSNCNVISCFTLYATHVYIFMCYNTQL